MSLFEKITSSSPQKRNVVYAVIKCIYDYMISQFDRRTMSCAVWLMVGGFTDELCVWLRQPGGGQPAVLQQPALHGT